MNFLSPAAFLFALTLPAVVAFYLLKRRRTPRVVPSTVLWRRFLAENRANSPFQKLRENRLLLLQLLLLALVVLALARPYFGGRAARAALRVVVLDASASMASTDETPSRFERARAQALELVDALDTRGGGRGVVLVAGAGAEVRQGVTGDKAALRRALLAARVTDCPTSLIEALGVAETLIRNVPDAEVHLFGDGAVPALDALENRGVPLVFHGVGRRVRNAGIVGIDVRANPEDPSRRAVFASAANFGPDTLSGAVELLFDGRLVESRRLTLAPTNTVPLVFAALQPRDGVFAVRLAMGDDLAVDDEARIVSRLPPPLRVLLLTRGNRFLEKALSAAGPNVVLTVAPGFETSSPAPDVAVVDDMPVPPALGANLLALNVADTNWFPGGVGEQEAPPIVDWKNTHPLLRFVGFDNVQIARALAVRTPPWAASLVDSPQSPLILAGETGRRRVVWVAFDVLRSTWPLRIGFPIFVANALEWLDPENVRAGRFLVRAGQPLRLPLSAPADSALVVAPDGARTTAPLGPAAREFVHAATDRCGVYDVQIGTNTFRYAVNLADPAESDTRPRSEIRVGRRGEVQADTGRRTSLEYWRWFALAGLGVLLLEWWWYHRRTA